MKIEFKEGQQQFKVTPEKDELKTVECVRLLQFLEATEGGARNINFCPSTIIVVRAACERRIKELCATI